MLISLPVGYINLESKIESSFVCGVQHVAKYSSPIRKNCKKGKIQTGSYGCEVLCNMGWRNAALHQSPTSVSPLQDQSQALRDTNGNPLQQQDLSTLCLSTFAFINMKMGDCMLLYPESLLSVIIRTSFIRKCHFFGLESGGGWNILIQQAFA